MSSISEESPLAEQLKNSVQSKIVEAGWTQEDDMSLAEYIVLMVANGKTQGQIASELAGDLLQDAQGTTEFAQWLSNQVAVLTGEGSADASAHPAGNETAAHGDSTIPDAYENDLGDSAPGNAPRGPKNLQSGRGGARGGRASQSRGNDSVLHRTRGNDRINSHVRGAPKGPRSGQNKDMRPGMQKALNSVNQGQNPMMPNGQLTPQQQMQFMAMMEQQAQMFSQLMPNLMQANMNNNFQPNGAQQTGRSLFDRVENGRGRGGARGRGRGGAAQNGNTRKNAEDTTGDGEGQTEDSAMETESTSKAPNDPTSTVCYFNLRCTNKACPYVHQSPAAPEGITMDMSDTCNFGAACKNPKCVGKHPSPATAKAQQAEEMCKFWPNCANPVCPYKHPQAPICSFGASCTNQNCKFTHLQVKCKYNPCTNPRCPYQHDDGQNKKYESYQWTPEKAKQAEEQSKDHVSNRKFVEDGAEEELIKPENGETNGIADTNGQQPQGEVIT